MKATYVITANVCMTDCILWGQSGLINSFTHLVSQASASDCSLMTANQDFAYHMAELPSLYANEDWDGNGAMPLSRASFELAVNFATNLSGVLPKPRIVVDPDGDICFKWRKSRNNKLELTFSNGGRYYAICVEKGISDSRLTTSQLEMQEKIERMFA